MTKPKPVTKDHHLYFVDNDALLCGEHLGMSAKYTGHDISGQKIRRASLADIEEMERGLAVMGEEKLAADIGCEVCGKKVQQ